MAALLPRDPEPASSIPPGVWVAIGVSVFIIVVAFVCMVLLLMRATQSHRKLLSDLEQRGIRLGQQVEHVGGDGVSRPRAVLRRNVLLPYNNNAAWGTLPSRDSLGRSQSSISKVQTTSTTDTAPRPQAKRGWSFTKRYKRQPKHIVLEKVRTGHLSAIIESPVPRRDTSASNLHDIQEITTPVDSLPPRLQLGFTEASPVSTLCAPRISSTPNSAPDLTRLKPPATYNADTVSSSGTVVRSPMRMIRSNSVPSVGSSLHDFHGHGTRGLRNGSVTNRYSGSAPGDPVPPLPLKLHHDRSMSNMEYSPSRRSVSSYESATSSILITGSPSAHRSPHAKLKQSPGHELHKSLVLKGPRPLLQSLHKSSQSVPCHFRENSIRSNVARLSMQDMATHSRHGSGDSVKSDRPKTADAQEQSVHNRSDNSLTGKTPRRQSRSQVTLEGSPTERVRSSAPVDGFEGAPTHQLSRASTNASSSSSNGNPFQWDPTPMQSGKPALPRKSPDRKKAHRRQNCIRLSVGPNNAAGGHSSTMSGIEEEPSNSSHRKQPSNEPEMIYLDTRPLPRPPSAGVFEPELRFDPTKIRAALSTGSPTLSLTNYGRDSGEASPRRHSEMSNGSGFSIPTFPSPGSSQPATSQSTFALPAASETSGLPGAGFLKLSAEEMISQARDKQAKQDHTYQGIFDPSPPNASPVESSSNPRTPLETVRPNSSMPKLVQTPPAVAASTTAGAEVGSEPNSSPPPILPEKSPFRASVPSPERANGRRSGGLLGPRAEPAKDLRKTVAELRRMNSDADDGHRTSRRYRQLGRESTMVALDVDEELPTDNDARRKRHKRGESGGSIKHSQSLIIPASAFRLVTKLEDDVDDAPRQSTRDISRSSASLPALSIETSPSSSPLGLGIAFEKSDAAKGASTSTPSKKTPPNRTSKTKSRTKSQMTSNSYTSLTDLMRASSSDIFDRREPRPTSTETRAQAEWGVVLGGSSSATAPRSIAEITSTPTVKIVSPTTAPHTGGSSRYSGSVWEDGESFWETPSVQEQRERQKQRHGGSPGSSRVLSELFPETPVNRGEKKVRKPRSTMVADDSDVENRTPPDTTTTTLPAPPTEQKSKPCKPIISVSIPSLPSTAFFPASPTTTTPIRPPTPPRSQSQSRSRSQSRSSRRASFHSTRSHRSQSQPSLSRYSKSSPAPSLHGYGMGNASTSSPHTPRGRFGRWIAAGLGSSNTTADANGSPSTASASTSAAAGKQAKEKDTASSSRGKRGGRKWRGTSKRSDEASANSNPIGVEERKHTPKTSKAIKERTSLRVLRGRRSVVSQQQAQKEQNETAKTFPLGVSISTPITKQQQQRGTLPMPRVVVETPSPRASMQSVEGMEDRGWERGRGRAGERPRGNRVTVIGDESEAEGALF
ncbi:hypothetical protein IWZ03DRAFT_363320 [Phyllosticta citriasiana]|uniref:Uncharacterized protein n=1 Tax=Phyllosticta citriasiana TaxID=595635 RepID=A0ABR1K8Z1_9PEZI